jgi:hypothetical protein
LINEWTLRKALYCNYLKDNRENMQAPAFFEVKKIFGGAQEESKEAIEVVASREEETFVVLILAQLSS